MTRLLRAAVLGTAALVFSGPVACHRPAAGSAAWDRGHFFVLAGEASTFDQPGGAETGKLRFGEEIRGGEEVRGWVRWKGSGSPRFVARNLVESEQERDVRSRETAKILALVPHPAVALRDALMTWGPAFDSPPLGNLAKGSRVKVYTAEGDAFAIELADPGGQGRYVAYVPMDAIAWEPRSEPPTGGEAPTRVANDVEVVELEEKSAAAVGGQPAASPAPEAAPREAEDLRVPKLLERVEPLYPAAARRAGIGGRVKLELDVSASGSVAAVTLLEGVRPDLDEAAIRAVRAWHYRPAEEGGRPIASRTVVEVRFDPR